jgi:hypothetical protein
MSRWLPLLVLAVASCGARDPLSDARQRPNCQPGEIVSCVCGGGSWAEQECSDRGRWGECSCDSTDGGLGVPDVHAEDVATSLPMSLDDPSRCLKGGTRFYRFSQYLIPAEIDATGEDALPIVYPETAVRLYVKPKVTLFFTTAELGQPIAVKRYEAVECNIPTFKQAGFSFSEGSIGHCWAGHQTVVVHEIVWSGATLDRLTLTFETGEPNKNGRTVGCVHYER